MDNKTSVSVCINQALNRSQEIFYFFPFFYQLQLDYIYNFMTEFQKQSKKK